MKHEEIIHVSDTHLISSLVAFLTAVFPSWFVAQTGKTLSITLHEETKEILEEKVKEFRVFIKELAI